MNDIIDKALSMCGIDMSKNPAYEYKLIRASIKKDQRVLSLDITLNFVMPIEACHMVTDMLAQQMGGKIGGVHINFSYGYMAADQQEIIRLFIPHMIEIVNGGYTGITSAICTDCL